MKYQFFIVKKFVKQCVAEWCSGCRSVVSFNTSKDPDHLLIKIKTIYGKKPQFYLVIENDVVNYHAKNQKNRRNLRSFFQPSKSKKQKPDFSQVLKVWEMIQFEAE